MIAGMTELQPSSHSAAWLISQIFISEKNSPGYAAAYSSEQSLPGSLYDLSDLPDQLIQPQR